MHLNCSELKKILTTLATTEGATSILQAKFSFLASVTLVTSKTRFATAFSSVSITRGNFRPTGLTITVYREKIACFTMWIIRKYHWIFYGSLHSKFIWNFYSLQHRKAWLFGNCLSTNSTPETVDFDASGLFGGIIHEGRKPGVDPRKFGFRIQKNFPYKRRTIKLQCFPLFSILKALGSPTVHYLRYWFIHFYFNFS